MKSVIRLFSVLALALCLASCGNSEIVPQSTIPSDPAATVTAAPTALPSPAPEKTDAPAASPIPTQTPVPQQASQFTAEDIPPFSGAAYVAINENLPFFTQEEITDVAFEDYPPLDNLGRCSAVTACIGQEIMPTAEREGIGMIKPAGWQIAKYDFVDGKYLYNRCHLIGFQLAGENANTHNLITGTRYMNVQGMLPIENKVADYVHETGNHVMYRVTPVYEGNNLLSNGVLMEAYSVEDAGAGICLCVFAYNVQPGVVIDYATGDNWLAEESAEPTAEPESSGQVTYILNTNTHKFHYPDCSSVDDMKEKNKQEFYGTRDEAIAQGFDPCGRCRP